MTLLGPAWDSRRLGDCQLKLDLRKPLFVFLGAWNPAIFQPGWVARYLFGFPEGASVDAGLLMLPNQPPLTFIKDIGVAVTPERVTLYVQRFDDETKSQVETTAKNIFEVLPHTPIGAFGVNFVFKDDDADPSLYDKLKTKDGIDKHFKVLSQQFVSTIQIFPNVILNFMRVPSTESVLYDLNFHHQSFDINNAEITLGGIVQRYYSKCLEIINQLYGSEHEGEISFEFPNQQGSEKGGAN